MKRLLIFSVFALTNLSLLTAQNAIKWKAESTLKFASSDVKPIMIYVRRVGDYFCERMENTTLSDPEIVDYINESFTSILMEISEPETFEFKEQTFSDPIDFMKKNGIEAPSIPSILFFDLNQNNAGVLQGMKSIEELRTAIGQALDKNLIAITEKLQNHEIKYISEAEIIVNATSFCSNQDAIINGAFGDMASLKGEYVGGGFGASGHYLTKVQFDEVPFEGTIDEDEDYLRLNYLLINADIGKYDKLEGTLKRLADGIKNCSLPSGGLWNEAPRNGKMTFKVLRNGRELTITLNESKNNLGRTQIELEYFVLNK